MHATRLWALASAALLGSSLMLCCADGEDLRPPRANEGGAGAFTPRGGETSGGRSDNGGVASSPLGGQTGWNTSGAPASGAMAGTGDGGGTQVLDLGEQLGFCGRLTGISEHARAVQALYVTAALLDCRVTRLMPHVQAPLTALRNEINSWSRSFWGCDEKRVDTFPLVPSGTVLTQGDANVLMDLYVEACQRDLALSPLERTDMLAALSRLAEPLIRDSSIELSQPACDAGGAGGAGGNGNGGLGGAP